MAGYRQSWSVLNNLLCCLSFERLWSNQKEWNPAAMVWAAVALWQFGFRGCRPHLNRAVFMHPLLEARLRPQRSKESGRTMANTPISGYLIDLRAEDILT